MEARSPHGRRPCRRAAVAACLGLLASLAVGACGGNQRQDKDEPKSTFRVDVVDASFPSKQKLAKRSSLVIKVRNASDRAIPNVAVTVTGFDERKDNPDLADPNRPVFVINGIAKDIGGSPEAKDAAPAGCETVYSSTWACGPLGVGQIKTFKWSVTAARPGSYKIGYGIAAGLNGKAKAIDENGARPTGVFSGEISDAPPKTRVAEDGHTIVTGTR